MPIEVESPEELGYDTITNNLSESSVADRKLSDLGLDLDLDDLLLCYGDHLGDPVLRAAVAAGGDGITADDVIVTPGAAAALFTVATSLLDRGDHAIVVRTNYATNLETPRTIGADLDIVDLSFDNGWALDLDEVADKIKPGTTRLISVTCPHNPTGTMLGGADLKRLVGLAERAEAILLVDETYRDLTHTGERIPLAATPGRAALRMKADGPEREVSYVIAAKAYAQQKLKVAPRTVDLSAQDLARHERERVHQQQVTAVFSSPAPSADGLAACPDADDEPAPDEAIVPEIFRLPAATFAFEQQPAPGPDPARPAGPLIPPTGTF